MERGSEKERLYAGMCLNSGVLNAGILPDSNVLTGLVQHPREMCHFKYEAIITTTVKRVLKTSRSTIPSPMNQP